MAKKYYRRRYKRVVKWAPNIYEIPTTAIQTNANATFFYQYTLASNPAQENASVSQTFTVKNVSLDFYCDMNTTSQPQYFPKIEDITVYIRYKEGHMFIFYFIYFLFLIFHTKF